METAALLARCPFSPAAPGSALRGGGWGPSHTAATSASAPAASAPWQSPARSSGRPTRAGCLSSPVFIPLLRSRAPGEPEQDLGGGTIIRAWLPTTHTWGSTAAPVPTPPAPFHTRPCPAGPQTPTCSPGVSPCHQRAGSWALRGSEPPPGGCSSPGPPLPVPSVGLSQPRSQAARAHGLVFAEVLKENGVSLQCRCCSQRPSLGQLGEGTGYQQG